MIDWKMFSSYKFNGMIGTELFSDTVVTVDYRAHKVGVGEQQIDYEKLVQDKYAVAPMLHTVTEGQENLVFFEAKVNGKDSVVYIDTGKNVSYIHNPDSEYVIGQSMAKPDSPCLDAELEVEDMTFSLHNVYEANVSQYDEFEYPVTLELNSDQLLKNDIVVTFDFINQKIILFKR